MPPGIQRRGMVLTLAALLLTLACAAFAAQAGETPRKGGTLLDGKSWGERRPTRHAVTAHKRGTRKGAA